MSTSTALLEEKYRRSMEFGKYLERHPDKDDPLHQALIRQNSLYRIALHAVLDSRLPKEPKKRKDK